MRKVRSKDRWLCHIATVVIVVGRECLSGPLKWAEPLRKMYQQIKQLIKLNVPLENLNAMNLKNFRLTKS